MPLEDSISVERTRMVKVLDSLERMISGDLNERIDVSPNQDALDAIARGINAMAGRLAALSEASSGLAHELNNPLMIMRGYLEHARLLIAESGAQRPPLSDLDRYLRKIDDSVDRMGSVIQQVREFARQSTAEKTEFPANEPLSSSFILIGEQLRLRNIEVSLDLCSDEVLLFGDKMRIEQVFLSILTNARDAIWEARGQGGGAVRALCREISGPAIEIEISDDGIGMSSETQEKMFNPFFTTKEVGKGAGIGLSASLGIVQEHGGEISCISAPGEGTCIRVRLPSLGRKRREQ